VIIRVKIDAEDRLGRKPVSEIVISSTTRGKRSTNDYRVQLTVPDGTETPEATILGHVEDHGVYALVRKALSVLGPQIELINHKKENEENG
jgi:hypothetical protein